MHSGRTSSFVGRFRYPLLAFGIWRVAHLVILLAFGGQSAARQVSGLHPDSHPGFFLWDGAWYQHILHSGYRPFPGNGQQPSNFFPLLPWVTRALRFVVRSELAAAVIVTNLAALAAVLLVYEVMRRWKDESVARWTVVLLLAFPTSFFLWEFYTEALLIAFCAGAILAMMNEKVWLAGLLGGMASMARPPGILIVVALAAIYLEQRRAVRWDVAWLALCVVGLGAVMLVLKLQAGDAFAFSSGTQQWGRHVTLPWVPVNDAARAYLHGTGPPLAGWSWTTIDNTGSPRDLVATYLFLALFIVSVFRKWSWGARALILTMTLAPIATGIVQSMARYVLAAWPGFGVAAELPGKRRAWVLVPVVAVLVYLSVGVLHDWSRGLFIA